MRDSRPTLVWSSSTVALDEAAAASISASACRSAFSFAAASATKASS